MRKSFRAIVPAPIRRPVRYMLDMVDRSQRALALARCMKRLRHQVCADAAIEEQLLVDLRAAWGNDGFSADIGYLADMARRMMGSRGPFLECGSGLSTVVAGVIAARTGTRFWSLEEDPEWYRRTRAALDRFGITSVTLRLAPLRLYCDFVWYDIEEQALPPQFTHVFCDGPSILEGEWAEPFHSNWRVGLVPAMRARGVRVGQIILDDAADPRALRLCRLWDDLGVSVNIVSTRHGPLILAQPANPAHPGFEALRKVAGGA